MTSERTRRVRGASVFEKLRTASALSRDGLRHIVAAKIASWIGDVQTYKPTLAWPHDGEFKAVWASYPEGDDKVRDRRFALYQLARSTAPLDGDTVECGVWRGAGSYLICKATARPGRTHHVFDSFEGLPRPSEHDNATPPDVPKWTEGDFATPVDVVQANLAGCNVVLYKGWIPERYGEVADRRFAFVHLNVNLVQPTVDSLEFFYDRLVPGGMLVSHEYGFLETNACKEAFDAFIRDKPERHVVHLTSGQGFIIKR
jgi:O-methyltransferase